MYVSRSSRPTLTGVDAFIQPVSDPQHEGRVDEMSDVRIFFEKNELVDLLIIRACHVDGVTVEIDRWRRGSVAEPAEEDGVIPPYY